MKTKADLEKLARELTLSLDLSEWNYGEGGKGSRAWKVPQGWATEEILAALTATHNDALEGAAGLIECGKFEPVDEDDAIRYAKHNQTIQRWADAIRAGKVEP